MTPGVGVRGGVLVAELVGVLVGVGVGVGGAGGVAGPGGGVNAYSDRPGWSVDAGFNRCVERSWGEIDRTTMPVSADRNAGATRPSIATGR